MSSINLFGPKFSKILKKKQREERKASQSAAQEMYEFPPSYNAVDHPGIKITAGPHTTARGYRKKHHKKSKKHHKKSKKHHKKSKKHHKKSKKHHKKTNRRQ